MIHGTQQTEINISTAAGDKYFFFTILHVKYQKSPDLEDAKLFILIHTLKYVGYKSTDDSKCMGNL